MVLQSALEWIKTFAAEIVCAPIGLITIFTALVEIYFTYLIVYGFFLSPAHHIPGPFLSRFGSFYYFYLLFRGFLATDVVELHKKYGIRLSLRRGIIGRSSGKAWP